MFGNHKDPFPLEDKAKCPDPFKDKIKCDGCQCWIDESDALKVEYYGHAFWERRFCLRCVPPYRTVKYPFCFGEKHDGPIRYFIKREVEVTEDGKDVKQKQS